MSKLPNMPYNSGIGKLTQVQFGGLRHHINCGDGEIYDMQNLTAENYPLISVRKKRGKLEGNVSAEATQIYADNGVFLQVDEFGVSYNGNRFLSEIEDYQNTSFVRYGDRVVMMPDRKVLNLKYRIIGWLTSVDDMPETAERYDAFAILKGPDDYEVYVWDGTKWISNGKLVAGMEADNGPELALFEDGTIYGEKATANTIRLPNETYKYFMEAGFKVGDAVTISGCTTVPENNKIAIIREIEPVGLESASGVLIRFSDYCFRMPVDDKGDPVIQYQESSVSIKREVPKLKVLFEHENRLWGANGKEIFASKLGDPFNWNCFDGLSTDSFYLQTQDKGEITAGISFGYPRFFREDSITTVYGSMPSAFQTQVTELLGVKQGEQLSLERMGGILLWLSNKGIVMYDGDTTYLQDQVFGDWKLSKVISKADAAKCYVHADIGPNPLADGERLTALFCYDMSKGVWTKENDPSIRSMTYMNGVIYALAGAQIIMLDSAGDLSGEIGAIESFAEFGDFSDGSPNRKAISKVQLRMEVGEGAFVLVKIRYNSSGEWMTIKTIEAGNKRSVYIPVIPHRCDHYRIRIEGTGDWTLYSMARELYVGSAVH